MLYKFQSEVVLVLYPINLVLDEFLAQPVLVVHFLLFLALTVLHLAVVPPPPTHSVAQLDLGPECAPPDLLPIVSGSRTQQPTGVIASVLLQQSNSLFFTDELL
jgi:hypothetical protein